MTWICWISLGTDSLINYFYFSVCWWTGSFMAAIFWHFGSSLLLLPLFFCQWSSSYWCHVYSLLVCCQCSWYSSIFWSHGAVIPFQPHGWAYTLWHWICTCFLWCQLRTSCQMVGLWVSHVCCQHNYLAWNWWDLVEGHWLVVKVVLTKICPPKFYSCSGFVSS